MAHMEETDQLANVAQVVDFNYAQEELSGTR